MRDPKLVPRGGFFLASSSYFLREVPPENARLFARRERLARSSGAKGTLQGAVHGSDPFTDTVS